MFTSQHTASRQMTFFLLKDFNAMFSVCVSVSPCLVSFKSKALQVWGSMCHFLQRLLFFFLSVAVTAFPSHVRFKCSDPEEGAGSVGTDPQAVGLCLVPRRLQVPSRVRPDCSILASAGGLSPQRGGLENSFRSGHFMRFSLFSLPSRFQFSPPTRSQRNGIAVFQSHPARCRPTWTGRGGGRPFPDRGGGTAGPRGTTNTRPRRWGPQTRSGGPWSLPAAAREGAGLQSRRQECAEGTRPRPWPRRQARKRDAAQEKAQESPNAPIRGSG